MMLDGGVGVEADNEDERTPVVDRPRLIDSACGRRDAERWAATISESRTHKREGGIFFSLFFLSLARR